MMSFSFVEVLEAENRISFHESYICSFHVPVKCLLHDAWLVSVFIPGSLPQSTPKAKQNEAASKYMQCFCPYHAFLATIVRSSCFPGVQSSCTCVWEQPLRLICFYHYFSEG